MKLFTFSLFVIIASMVSGAAIAELSYLILLMIKCLAYGEIDFRWSEVLRGFKRFKGGMCGWGSSRFWYSIISLPWHKGILSRYKGMFVAKSNFVVSGVRVLLHLHAANPRHNSNYRCVGYARSPQSHSYLCCWEFTPLPPSCNSNYSGD